MADDRTASASDEGQCMSRRGLYSFVEKRRRKREGSGE